MKKCFLFLFAMLLAVMLPSCGGISVITAPSEAEHSTTAETEAAVTEETKMQTTEFSTPAETVPETTENDNLTTAAVSETLPFSAREESGTTAAEGTSAAASSLTSAAPDTTQAATSRRTILDRILENIDADKKPRIPDKDFFNDAVFVGDSVTLGLKNYATARRNQGKSCLGTAQFLCAGSLGYTNSIAKVTSDSLHPTYKGQKTTIEEGLQKASAGKTFLMLGMNDFSAYPEKTWRQSVRTLISRIREKNPGIGIYIQSVTPILDGMEHGRFSNENIRAFNGYLENFCAENDCVFVDIYSDVMADESGHLKEAYCGDPAAMGIHMSNAGSGAWASYLTQTFCGTES